VNIADALKAIMVEFGIVGKVRAITTDGAANMIAACRELKIERVQCAAHALQLAVRAALSQEVR
jgi:hypothetical protein